MINQSVSWFERCRRSIRYRLTAWGVALLAAALLVVTLVGSIYTRSQILQAATELQKEVAKTTAQRVNSFVTHKLQRLEDAAVAMSLSPIGAEAQRSLAQGLLKNDPAYAKLSVFDTDELKVFELSEHNFVLNADRKDQRGGVPFTEARRGNQFIGAANTAAHGEPYITLALPLKSSSTEVGGVLIAQVNLKFLWDVFAEIKFSRGGYAYLVDEHGNLMAHRDPSLLRQTVNPKNLDKIAGFLKNSATGSSPAEEGPGIGGDKVLRSYAPVSRFGWVVVVEEPIELALADFAKLRRYGGILMIFGLLLGAVAIAWISRKVTRPIQELRAGVATIGQGNLDHRVAITTNDEIGQLASEFNHMAEVLQNSYTTLEQKVEQRTHHVSVLYEVMKTVNQSFDLNRLLQEVVERITQIFHFDTTRVYLYDSARDYLILRAYFETHHDPWTGIELFRKRHSVVGHVAETREAVVFADVQSDPRYAEMSSSKASRDAGFHFLAVLPIKTHGKLLGTMTLSGKETRVLADEELRLLNSMCEHIAVAVEKAHLFEQVATRSRHLEALNTIGAAVSQSLDLNEVLDQAVDKIAKTVRFDAVWIYQLERDGLLHLKAFHGLRDDMAANLGTRSVDVGVSGKVMATGELLVFEDIRNDERYRALSRQDQVESLAFESTAAFPVKAKEKLIGTLHVASRTKRHFSADDIELIQSLAQQIGVATENAMLFAEVRDKTKELARTNQELLDATRAKAEFIAAMSHELRTPLNIVIGSSDLLRDGFFGRLNGGQEDATDKICRNARVLLKMINDVLTISRFDANRIPLEITSVDVDEVLDQARAMVEQINRDNHLEVRWDVDSSIPPLLTDSLKLQEILQNLIGNAFKFTPKGHIEVRVNHRPEVDRVEFTVADTGIGIAVEDQAKIFNAFEQLKDAHTGHFNGVGLGLNIVRRYLDLMEGDIFVESQPGNGAKFTFSVPRSLRSNS